MRVRKHDQQSLQEAFQLPPSAYLRWARGNGLVSWRTPSRLVAGSPVLHSPRRPLTVGYQAQLTHFQSHHRLVSSAVWYDMSPCNRSTLLYLFHQNTSTITLLLCSALVINWVDVLLLKVWTVAITIQVRSICATGVSLDFKLRRRAVRRQGFAVMPRIRLQQACPATPYLSAAALILFGE